MLDFMILSIHPLLAAEGGTALGWLLVALFVAIGKVGWIVALMLGFLMWKLRHSRSNAAALTFAVAIPTASLCLIVSAIYMAMPPRNAEPPPQEVQPAILTKP